MLYPPNFPRHIEKPLIEILKKIEINFPLPKNADEFIKTVKKIIRDSTAQEAIDTPPLWQFRFVLERNGKHFGTTFTVGLKKALIKTKVRSHSGIIPLSIFTGGVGCPFNCHYCANEPNMPKSYFSDEPAVMRAIHFNFDPYRQVFGRMLMFYLNGHPVDKIDLIIQGGTFSFYDKKYREWFLKRAYDAANTSIEIYVKKGVLEKKPSSTLLHSQKINETGVQRIIGVTIETRPDFIDKKEITFLRRLGVTRVEIGVQAVDDAILTKINRGHGVKEIINATRLLKETGFKITYHLMPGLPGSTPEHDLEMLREVFENPSYKPDNIKFYPTSVVKFSKLEEWYRQGEYVPYNETQLQELTIAFKKDIVPRWLRIQRLVRDLTVNDIVVDAFPSNMRQNIELELIRRGVKCPCIRCREIKLDAKSTKLKLKVTKYEASGGIEYFLEYVDENDRLYGLLRLRIPSYILHNQKPILKELEDCALIRELHVYGQAIQIGKDGGKRAQHQGLGKLLLQKAEEIAADHKVQKIAIIAGVGVKEYYKNLYYNEKKTYIVRTLT